MSICLVRFRLIAFELEGARNEPEKGLNPRMWKVSTTLIEMLNALPKTCEQVFPSSLKSMKETFLDTRKRLAETLQNPRLL